MSLNTILLWLWYILVYFCHICLVKFPTTFEVFIIVPCTIRSSIITIQIKSKNCCFTMDIQYYMLNWPFPIDITVCNFTIYDKDNIEHHFSEIIVHSAQILHNSWQLCHNTDHAFTWSVFTEYVCNTSVYHQVTLLDTLALLINVFWDMTKQFGGYRHPM